MNNWYGNLIEDATVTLTFNTFDADGASVTITDLVASDVFVVSDGTTTQATPGAGVTVGIDSGATGSHQLLIDTSDTTDAGFYATGHDYQVRIVGATVATKTVNIFVGSFSIENRYMVGTDGAAPANEYDTQLDANMSTRAPANEYDTQLDANVSTRAPANEYDTQLDANVSTRATSAKQDTMETTLNLTAVDSTTAKDSTVAKDATVAKDSTVSKETTAAKDATVSKEATAAKDSTVAKDATVAKEVTLNAVAVQTTRVDGLIEDDSGDQYTTKALSQAPSGTGGDATEAKQDEILTNFFADEVFDPTAGTIRYNQKGTVTQLSKKDLKDPDGNAVDSTEDIIAEATEQ